MGLGADMLIKTLLSAIGLDAEVAQKQLIELQQWNINSIKSFNSRLQAQEANTREVMRKIDLIIDHLEIDDGRQHEQPTEQRAIAGTESATESVAAN